MNEQQKRWHAEYVQWRAVMLLVTIITGIIGAVYVVASNAQEMAQNNKNEIIRIGTTQTNQYNEIQKTLQRIEDNLKKN